MKTRLFAIALCFASVAYAQADTTPASPITKLEIIDVKAGSGKEAIAGSTVTVHYTGWLFDAKASKNRGAQFDSSIGKSPFNFPLGAKRVIKGWDTGVTGMKIGGKRTLIIPSELAYGTRGAGNVIPANAALVFDIELLDVK
ncbi:FKBP-type peptidyl-prolyl cis-trans isomerase [Iodobacter ciconiae]|nr:FKBP-type peptidyl-prolyl cis-trans isomerase [Iodobacter ciconiae]